MRKNLLKYSLYLLGFLMLGYIVVNADWGEMFTHLKTTPLRVIIFLLLFQCLTMLLINVQWRSLAAHAGEPISFFDMLLVNAQGTVVDGLTPGMKMGGEVVRLMALKNKAQVDWAQATIVVGLQKTFSLLSFLFLSLGSLIWFSLTLGSGYRYYQYLFTAAVAIFLLAFFLLIILSLKPDTIIRLLGKFFKNSPTGSKIQETLKKYSLLLQGLLKNKRVFLAQLGLGSFIWSFYAFKLLVLLRGYHLELAYITVAAVTFLAYIVGMIPLFPGGIGSFESAMILLLKLAGIPIEMGVTVAIVFRAATFWFEFLLSGLILLLAQFSPGNRGGKNAKVQV